MIQWGPHCTECGPLLLSYTSPHTSYFTLPVPVVGLCLLMWTFTFIYSTYNTLKYNNAPFSQNVVNPILRYLVWHICRDSQWEPMGAQITSIVFPPMRSELTKLNKSTYPQSKILSPFSHLKIYNPYIIYFLLFFHFPYYVFFFTQNINLWKLHIK